MKLNCELVMGLLGEGEGGGEVSSHDNIQFRQQQAYTRHASTRVTQKIYYCLAITYVLSLAEICV
jgi:hypothetical protein